jgi:hypothetical protein
MSDGSPATGEGATGEAATTFVPKMSKTPAIACFTSISCPFFWLAVGQDNAASRRSHGNNVTWGAFPNSCDGWATSSALALGLFARWITADLCCNAQTNTCRPIEAGLATVLAMKGAIRVR